MELKATASLLLVFLSGVVVCLQKNLAENSTESSIKFGKMMSFRPLQYSAHINETRNNKSLASKELQDIFSYFHSISPPYQLYILYDDTAEDVDDTIKVFSKIGPQITMMKLEYDVNMIAKVLFSKPSIISTDRRHVTLLCSLENTINVFQTVSAKNLESRSFWWIVIVTNQEARLAIERLLREGSQVIAIQKEEKGSLRFYSTRAEYDGTLRFHNNGKWTKTPTSYKSHLTSDVFVNLEEFYANFNGREITFSSVNSKPFIVLEKQRNGSLVAVAGFEHTLISAMGRALNFSYRMVTPADGKWGGPLPNGSVTGMIGDVAKRIAHLAICEITITVIREEVIDFSYPYYIESLTLVSRTPKEKNRTFAVLSTFTPLVWIYIAISVLVTGIVLYAEDFILQHSLALKLSISRLDDTLFNMFRSIVDQENRFKCEHWHQKFLLLFWSVFCLILSALYSGILIAYLITPSFDKPINGLIDLPAAVKEGFTLVVTADTSSESLFKSAADGIYAETWKLFNHKDRSKSFIKYSVDSYVGILENKLVLINSQVSSRYLAMDRGINRYHFARDTFAPQFYGIAAISGLPFLPVVDKMIMYMLEGGLIKKWEENEFQKVAGNNTITESEGARPFSVDHLQAAFYILMIGCIVGAVALMMEQIFSCM